MSEPNAKEPIVVAAEGVWGDAFERLAKHCRLVRLSAEVPPWDIVLREASALVVRNRTKVTAELLIRAPRLAIVARAGSGLDNIDIQAADAAGVVVTAAIGANAVSVAEHALSFALALLRGLVGRDKETRAGGWDRSAGRELAGKVWGILGLGSTGLAVARLLKGFDVQRVGVDPYISAGDGRLGEAGVRLVPLDEMLGVADVVSVHLPLTPETFALVGNEFLSKLKPGAVLLNLGRGEVLDEEALIAALDAGMLAGAGLDVRAKEPPCVGRLEEMDNVVLTPHIAGITVESQERVASILVGDIEAVLAGAPAKCFVGKLNTAPSTKLPKSGSCQRRDSPRC